MSAHGECNGMPDLRTSARSNAGEHYIEHYRYDGHGYRRVLGYIAESLVNDWTVARYPERDDPTVVCR